MVAPAVVEAVAADIRMEERGAMIIPLMFQFVIQPITTFRISEAEITPAMVPVPIKRTATGAILDNP